MSTWPVRPRFGAQVNAVSSEALYGHWYELLLVSAACTRSLKLEGHTATWVRVVQLSQNCPIWVG